LFQEEEVFYVCSPQFDLHSAWLMKSNPPIFGGRLSFPTTVPWLAVLPDIATVKL
jgi:hypothetical protein